MRFALNIQKCRRVLITRTAVGTGTGKEGARKRPLRIKGDEVYDKHKRKFRNTTDICNVRITYDKYIRMAGLKTFFRSEGNFSAVKKGAAAPFLKGGRKNEKQETFCKKPLFVTCKYIIMLHNNIRVA